MPVCAWYDSDQQKCTHTANLTGHCGNPLWNAHRQCEAIYLIGSNRHPQYVDFQGHCKECGESFGREIRYVHKRVYDDAVKRGIVVCCSCHSKRLREVHGTWTEQSLAYYAAMEEFAEHHPELTLNQCPDDWA
jgi:hypothetical protein